MTDGRALIALDAHLACLRQLTTAGGGSVVERAGVIAARSPHPLPFLVNVVARTGVGVSPEAALEVAAEVFPDRGVEVLCLDGRDDDLRTAAVASGWQPGTPDPLQHIDHAPPEVSMPPGIDLRAVIDERGAADVATVAADAHAAYDDAFPDDFFGVILGPPRTVLAPQIAAVVAYEDGRPLATAQVFRHGSVAYVGWVAVVRSAMRRGLGTLVTTRVVRDAFEHGASEAVLLASPMGAPVYRQMGFVDVGTLTDAYRDAPG